MLRNMGCNAEGPSAARLGSDRLPHRRQRLSRPKWLFLAGFCAMVNSVRYTHSLDGISVPIAAPAKKSSASNDIVGAVRKPRRVYEASFKLEVVTYALTLPAMNRIKPTCRSYPGVEPVQGARPPSTCALPCQPLCRSHAC